MFIKEITTNKRRWKIALSLAVGVAAVVFGAYAITQAQTVSSLSIASSSMSDQGSLLSVTSVDENTDTSLLTGNATSSVSVGLVSGDGANTNGVSVAVQLLQGGNVIQQAVYNNQNILHESPQTYWLSFSGVPNGTYTVAVVVYNPDGSVNASFSNLGSVVVSGSTVTSTSTATSTVTNAIQIIPTNLPDATASSSYTETLTASTTMNGPFTWSIAAGTLPDGLALDASATGTASTLSGMPTTVGSSTFTVNVANATSSASQAYMLNVDAPTSTSTGTASSTPSSTYAVQIIPASLPDATVSSSYSQMLTASTSAPTSFTWSVASGTLPSGLSLNTGISSTTATITGTPTASGSSTFTIGATDGMNSSTQVYALNVDPASVTTTSTATSTGTPTTAGDLEVTSLYQPLSTVNASDTQTTITPYIIATNGANVGNVTVQVALTQNGTVVDDQAYGNQDILHEYPQAYPLTTSSTLSPGSYTIAVTVYNADDSVNASFPDLGTLTVM